LSSKKHLSLVHIDIQAFKGVVILLSAILSVSIAYLLEPQSFQYTWKGRALYLMFLWLLTIELALAWRKLSEKRPLLGWIKIIATTITLATPTIYMMTTLLFGLNYEIMEMGKFLGVPYNHGLWFLEESWPLSLEYLLFTGLFAASIWLMHGVKGLKKFPASLFFLGAIGFFYLTDTFYPYGTFATLQIFVPVTVQSAAFLMSWMGYETLFRVAGSALIVTRDSSQFIALMFWPCAGVHSLFVYTLSILLFVKEAVISFKWKVACAAVGALGTFLTNILRIASICSIGVNLGPQAAQMFHKYYGELYFIGWFLTYLMVIVSGHKIWTRLSELGTKLAGSRSEPST